jgi:hypothetical protein
MWVQILNLLQQVSEEYPHPPNRLQNLHIQPVTRQKYILHFEFYLRIQAKQNVAKCKLHKYM